MKVIRYKDDSGNPQYGWLNDKGEPCHATGSIGESLDFQDKPVTGDIVLLNPVQPPVVIGVAMNYRSHAEELGKALPERPFYFIKLPNAVQSPGCPIILPRSANSQKVDYEGELAVVLNRDCKNIKKEEAMSCVLGYTIANDVSARDWQFEWGGGQFCRAKSFDGFCPLGPCIVTANKIPEPRVLKLETKLNCEIMQTGTVNDLIFDIPTLIEFLSASTTLPKHTVILTGTPGGVGATRKPPRYLKAGDTVSITIEPIGTLTNPVLEEVT